MATLLKLHKLCNESYKCQKYWYNSCEEESIRSIAGVLFSGPNHQILINQISQRTQNLDTHD
jgi:hypothetical protein